MNNIIKLIPVLLLVSCGTQVSVVKIPVVQPWPEPPVISRPDLAINKIDSNNIKYDELNKALQITIEQLMTYSYTLENYLNVYRKQPSIPEVK